MEKPQVSEELTRPPTRLEGLTPAERRDLEELRGHWHVSIFAVEESIRLGDRRLAVPGRRRDGRPGPGPRNPDSRRDAGAPGSGSFDGPPTLPRPPGQGDRRHRCTRLCLPRDAVRPDPAGAGRAGDARAPGSPELQHHLHRRVARFRRATAWGYRSPRPGPCHSAEDSIRSLLEYVERQHLPPQETDGRGVQFPRARSWPSQSSRRRVRSSRGSICPICRPAPLTSRLPAPAFPRFPFVPLEQHQLNQVGGT